MILLIKTEEGFAYDVEITGEDATLKQYIDALDAFLDEKVAPCLGCDNCCYQRIPLTLPDFYQYGKKEEESPFLRDSVVVEKQGKSLDIRLRRKEDESCIYLDTTEQRCKNHPCRGLVCHTYICIPQTEKARTMRECLINEGEDALVGYLFDAGLLQDNDDLRKDYPVKESWQGKAYEDILLKEVLPQSLWQDLTKNLS